MGEHARSQTWQSVPLSRAAEVVVALFFIGTFVVHKGRNVFGVGAIGVVGGRLAHYGSFHRGRRWFSLDRPLRAISRAWRGWSSMLGDQPSLAFFLQTSWVACHTLSRSDDIADHSRHQIRAIMLPQPMVPSLALRVVAGPGDPNFPTRTNFTRSTFFRAFNTRTSARCSFDML